MVCKGTETYDLEKIIYLSENRELFTTLQNLLVLGGVRLLGEGINVVVLCRCIRIVIWPQ